MQGIVNGVAQQEDKNGVIEAIKEPLPQPLPEEGGEWYVLQLYSIFAFYFQGILLPSPWRGVGGEALLPPSFLLYGAGGEALFSTFLFEITI